MGFCLLANAMQSGRFACSRSDTAVFGLPQGSQSCLSNSMRSISGARSTPRNPLDAICDHATAGRHINRPLTKHRETEVFILRSNNCKYRISMPWRRPVRCARGIKSRFPCPCRDSRCAESHLPCPRRTPRCAEPQIPANVSGNQPEGLRPETTCYCSPTHVSTSFWACR